MNIRVVATRLMRSRFRLDIRVHDRLPSTEAHVGLDDVGEYYNHELSLGPESG